MSQIVALRRGGSAASLKEKVTPAHESASENSTVVDKVIRQCDVGTAE
jgi:hypothetical protein